MTRISRRAAHSIQIALLGICVAGPAAAQKLTLWTLQPGDTIKVWSVAPSLNGALGTLTALRADTLVLGEWPPSPEAAVRTSVPYMALRRVDVRRGLHRSAARTVVGMVLGGAAGMFVGAFGGAAIECAAGCDDEWGGFAGFIVGGTVGLAGGAITGGVIGARRRPNWEYVSLRR
jgi:hypothetical protein